MRAVDGHIRPIDLVGLTREPMTELICTDLDAFFRLIPREKCLHMLDIPYFGRPENADERERLAVAFAESDEPSSLILAGPAGGGRSRSSSRLTSIRFACWGSAGCLDSRRSALPSSRRCARPRLTAATRDRSWRDWMSSVSADLEALAPSITST